MKKKLLITTDTYFPKTDGVLIFLERIVPYLTKDFDITIAAPVFNKKEMKPIGTSRVVGFPISNNLGLGGYKSVKPSWKNRKKLRELVKEADIVWSQDLAFLGGLSIYYGKKYKKPVFNYVHQITWEQVVDILGIPKFLKVILSFVVKRIVLSLYNKCTVLMVPYKELATALEEKGVVSIRAIVHLGVDGDFFHPPERKADAKKALGIDPRKKIIGYCGRVSREKDIPTLKRAFVRLKEEYPDVMLLIVGSGPEEEIAKLKRVPGIRVTGFVKEVVPYLQAMDIFVMPSLTETTSLATLEAMACGIPIITTKVGYIKDYILHKYNGLFFGKQNDYILRRRIELLLNDEATRRMLSENARKTVLQRFSWENTIEDIKKAFSMY